MKLCQGRLRLDIIKYPEGVGPWKRLPREVATVPASFQEAFGQHSQEHGVILGVVLSQKLDSEILVGLFQLRIFLIP